MTYVDILGTVGASIILIFFLLSQTHKISVDSKAYDLFNFLGSGLLIAYSILISAWPFVVLNGIWAIYSLKDLIMKKK